MALRVEGTAVCILSLRAGAILMIICTGNLATHLY